jgi:hypothetical protein
MKAKKWLVYNRVGVTGTGRQCLALAGILAGLENFPQSDRLRFGVYI